MSYRKKDIMSLEEALNQFISNKRLNKGLSESLIKQKWSEIVGDVIAKHTKSLYLKDGVLFINFDSAIVKNEFSYNKEKAISLINDKLGYRVITDLVAR